MATDIMYVSEALFDEMYPLHFIRTGSKEGYDSIADIIHIRGIPKQKPKKILEAEDILEICSEIQKQRGENYDKGKERSMGTITKVFNTLTGLNLTEEQGWLFMISLKLTRMNQGKFHFDNYLDLTSYSALMAETVANEKAITRDSNDSKD